LERLGKEITDHLFRGTILNGEFFLVDVVSDKIEFTVKVFGLLAARPVTILCVQWNRNAEENATTNERNGNPENKPFSRDTTKE
jgi:hypothetical protein